MVDSIELGMGHLPNAGVHGGPESSHQGVFPGDGRYLGHHFFIRHTNLDTKTFLGPDFYVLSHNQINHPSILDLQVSELPVHPHSAS